LELFDYQIDFASFGFPLVHSSIKKHKCCEIQPSFVEFLILFISLNQIKLQLEDCIGCLLLM